MLLYFILNKYIQKKKKTVNSTRSQWELFRHFTGRRLTGWSEATSRRPENSRLCRGHTAKHVNRKGARPGKAWQGRCRDNTGSISGREEPRWRKWWVELYSIRSCFILTDQIVWVYDWYCTWARAVPCSTRWSHDHTQLYPEAITSVWNRAVSWNSPDCRDSSNWY